MEFINGLMEAYIKEIGTKIRFLDMENITGTTAGPIKGIGWIIICTVKEFICGWMVESMRASMLMIRSKDLEYTLIQTAGHTKDNG